jgi:NADH dehydrogenase
MKKTRVLIVGGGFGGLYAALEFEKRRSTDIEVTLISEENFFLFTQMLHEVAASDLDLTHIVNPIRKMLRHVRFFEGEVQSVDLANRCVVLSHGFDQHTHTLEYDHIVFAPGCVTNFYNIPGLQERAVTMKSLGDAIATPIEAFKASRALALVPRSNSRRPARSSAAMDSQAMIT